MKTPVLSPLSRPGPFRRMAALAWPVCAVAGLACLGPGLYQSLIASPPDYQQGETVRIMYVHVPSAWGALLLYAAMGIAAFTAYIWKHALADIFCAAAAPIGATLAALCLITGSLWGKPMWGTWWVWDARLTSMLVLFFFYLGAIALRGAFADQRRGATASQLLLLLGVINLPIVKFSVEWWNTLHQGESIFKAGGPSISPGMLLPLWLMTAAGFFLCMALLLIRMLALLPGQLTKKTKESDFISSS